MARIKSNLRNTTVAERIQIGKARLGTLTSGSQVSIDAGRLAEYRTTIEILEAKEILVNRNKEILAQSVRERDEADRDFMKVDSAIANEINSKSDDPVVLLSTGFPLIDAGGEKAQLGMVTRLEAEIGKNTGEVCINFKRVKSATGYEFQISEGTPDNWTNAGAAGKTSKYTFRGLNPGKKYWFRVRAIKGEEKGAWSDPATTTAPY